MKINIVAGGPPDLIPGLGQYDGDTVVWVGVDRGVYYLLQAGIRPDRAFGDFDSVTDLEWAEIQKEVAELAAFQPEKDETDMELALNWALGQMPDSVSVFGATGGRIDHMLANVQLLLKPLENKSSIPIEIIDEKNILYVKKPGSYTVNRIEDLKYISFLPLTPCVEGITLENFKYPLKERHISMGSTLCISNELISAHGTFSFSEGILLVVRSKD